MNQNTPSVENLTYTNRNDQLYDCGNDSILSHLGHKWLQCFRPQDIVDKSFFLLRHLWDEGRLSSHCWCGISSKIISYVDDDVAWPLTGLGESYPNVAKGKDMALWVSRWHSMHTGMLMWLRMSDVALDTCYFDYSMIAVMTTAKAHIC